MKRDNANNCSALIGLAVVLIAAILMSQPAQAQTFTTLYSFSGGDGAKPYAGVICDPAGNLYGTTLSGGAFNDGIVFMLDSSGNRTTLYNLVLKSGGAPVAGLVNDAAGHFYGATENGGSRMCTGGCGVVFRVDVESHYRVQYFFTGLDGAGPEGTLIRDSAGSLYGTTFHGGTSDAGTVFKLQAGGILTTLYNFTGGADGGYPTSGLVQDSLGNLYGTTPLGGAFGVGTVFEIDSSGIESVLYSFTGGADGSSPNTGLILDSAGNLYGVTVLGGVGAGVVFKIDPAGVETVLHAFTHDDGIQPYGTLLRDAAGNLYGTTFLGGISNYGTVYRLEASGRFRVLHTFTHGPDGGNSLTGLVRDNAGNLYGTTASGGTGLFGTVFKISF